MGVHGGKRSRGAEPPGLHAAAAPHPRKELTRVGIFKRALGLLDATSLAKAGSASVSLHEASGEAAKVQALDLVSILRGFGEVELSNEIIIERAKVETWTGVLHSVTEERFEVTLTAYVPVPNVEASAAHRRHGHRVGLGCMAPLTRRPLTERGLGSGLGRLCAGFGFVETVAALELPRPSLGRPLQGALSPAPKCPYTGVPARLATFHALDTTVLNAGRFCGALRAALKAASGTTPRVDGFGSWKLVPHLRYENYHDFDPDQPFRFMLEVPPYAQLETRCFALSPPTAVDPALGPGLVAGLRGGLAGATAPPEPQQPRISLVLDLDETLIHTEIVPISDPDFVFTLPGPGGCQPMYVRVRPHALAFLAECARLGFEIIVFTASERPYCEQVLRHLDPAGSLIEHALCRDECTFLDGEFVKDLGTLRRDLRRTLLVDNRPEMYCFHPQNGIPISSWFEDRRDCELLRLLPSLRRLAGCGAAGCSGPEGAGAGQLPSNSDVREYVRHHWRTHFELARVRALDESRLALSEYAVGACINDDSDDAALGGVACQQLPAVSRKGGDDDESDEGAGSDEEGDGLEMIYECSDDGHTTGGMSQGSSDTGGDGSNSDGENSPLCSDLGSQASSFDDDMPDEDKMAPSAPKSRASALILGVI